MFAVGFTPEKVKRRPRKPLMSKNTSSNARKEAKAKSPKHTKAPRTPKGRETPTKKGTPKRGTPKKGTPKKKGKTPGKRRVGTGREKMQNFPGILSKIASKM